MAAPDFVPLKPTDSPRSYSSPPRRPESWVTDRPGEVGKLGQPRSDRVGNQGPDQGYVLHLVHHFDGKLTLAVDEHQADAFAGAITVALKRASLFGRAPVIHDLTVAFTIWGFFDEPVPADLLALRRARFAEVRNPHHYAEQRAIADAVPEATLRLLPDAVTSAHQADWLALLDP